MSGWLGGHGGPDALGIPVWDFSTNSNACGPAPLAERAVQQADASRYPDPSYVRLREQLGDFHGVAAERILLAASASEFIGRFLLAVALERPDAGVFIPAASYGDVARAADTLGLRRVATAAEADLVWHTEPASPCGSSAAMPAVPSSCRAVIDAAYAPLRLSGGEPEQPTGAWRLMSPNKALGLTGVRAAYAVAPANVDPRWSDRLQRLAPSWPLGAHGVALLESWVQAATQCWLEDSLQQLREWKRDQLQLCDELGWTCQPSVSNFFVARLPGLHDLAALRQHGIKLRDTASFGLPGQVRVSVQRPAAQAALAAACRQLERIGNGGEAA